MERLRAFVFSPQGRAFAKVHQAWGTDPATGIADDFVAYNVRAGLLVSLSQNREPDPEEPQTNGRIVTDLEERMKAYG